MIRCSRCCLHKSMSTVNLIVIFFGMLMIIYCLWLLKKWFDGVHDMSFITSSVPEPWFIYTCLGIGIAICLSTLSGHMVANCISSYTLAIYIVSICFLVSIQVVVTVTIFFKIDWESQILKYIDEQSHKTFESFVLFHLIMCRFIVMVALVAQINAVILAVIFWTVRGEQRTQCCISDPPRFTYSFLADYNSPALDDP